MNETHIQLNLRSCGDREIENLVFQIINNREFERSIEILNKKLFRFPVTFYATDNFSSPVYKSFSEYCNPSSDIYKNGLKSFVVDFLRSHDCKQMLESGTTIEFLCKKLIFDMELIHLASAAVFTFNEKYIKKQNLLLMDNSYSLEPDKLVLENFNTFNTSVIFSTANRHNKIFLGFRSSRDSIVDLTTVEVWMERLIDNGHWYRVLDTVYEVDDKNFATNLTNDFKEVLEQYYDENK